MRLDYLLFYQELKTHLSVILVSLSGVSGQTGPGLEQEVEK